MTLIVGPRTARFTDQEVLDYRRWADEGTLSHADLARERGIGLNSARRLLNGGSYEHVATPVPTARFTRFVPANPAAFTDAEVVEWRKKYRKKKLKVAWIAKRTGVTKGIVQRMLNGHRPYDHIPDPIPLDFGRRRRRAFTDKVVIAMRQEYPKPGVSLLSLKKQYGGDIESIAKALLGHTYKDVPGPLEKLKQAGRKVGDTRNLTMRRFSDEVVLFMRLQYKPRVVSTVKIARHYGVHTDVVHAIVTGHTYKEVPCIVEKMASMKAENWTDEQVLQMRRDVQAKKLTGGQIARSSGVPASTVYSMLRGRSYSHVPEALTARNNGLGRTYRSAEEKEAAEAAYKAAQAAVEARLRRPPKPIPIRPVRLLDHDERVDLVSLRAQMTG